MKGRGYFNYARNCWEIAILDRSSNTCYTMEFKAHKLPESRHCEIELTRISESEFTYGILDGLAQALQEMGMIPKDATSSELKATKYHLEDMRKLGLK